MEVLRWDTEPPDLRSPILVCAFRGWNDAAGAASIAVRATARALDAEQIAHVDPEELFDFQANRPTITLREGQTDGVEWPQTRLLVARPAGIDHDLLLLDGTEPNLRWRTFTEQIADAAHRMNTRMIVSMGALIADVAHTLPVPITGIGSDRDLVERLGFHRSNYEGPTGVVGVLHDTCRRLGMSSASLWAAVPHYIASVPNPKAALALVRKLEGLTGIAVQAAQLEEEARSFEEQIDRAVTGNPEVETLVSQLEESQREAEDGELTDLPSGETIASDFERYLRQQGPDD